MASPWSGTFMRRVEFPMQASFLASDPLKCESQKLSLHLDGLSLAVPTMQQPFDGAKCPGHAVKDYCQEYRFFPPEHVSIDQSPYETLIKQFQESCNLKEIGCRISRALHPQLLPITAKRQLTGHLYLLKASRSPGSSSACSPAFLEPPMMEREFKAVSNVVF